MQTLPATGGGQYYEVLTRVRFGRFDDILAMESDGTENPIFRGFWDFGQGYAHLRAGHVDVAQAYREVPGKGGPAVGADCVRRARNHGSPQDQDTF